MCRKNKREKTPKSLHCPVPCSPAIRPFGQDEEAATCNRLIKSFVKDQSSSAMFQVMKRYRYNVIKCQRFYRAFRRCKHSRIVALSLRWSTLEAEYGRYIQEKRRNELKGKILALKEKGAEEGLDRLSIHQRVLKREQDGIPEDPGDLYLGEENAAHLDYHLLKGLENIVDKAAPK